MAKECPEDKILNPATNRCVKKTSALGKKLSKGENIEPKAPKECPEGKVRNPATGRCVKANSKTLKKKEDISVPEPSVPVRRLDSRRPPPITIPVFRPRGPSVMTRRDPSKRKIVYMKKKEDIPVPEPVAPIRRLDSRRPAPLIIPKKNSYRDNPLILPSPSVGSATSYITPGSSSATTIQTAPSYASIASASSYHSIPSASTFDNIVMTPRGDDIFYDAIDDTPSKAIRTAQIKEAIKNNEFFYDVKQYTPEQAFIKNIKSKRLTPNQRLKNIQDISKKIKQDFENITDIYYDAPELTTKQRKQQILKDMRTKPLSQIFRNI